MQDVKVLKRRTKPGPIGLDVGASSIKMLQLIEEEGRPAVLAAAHCEIPAELDDPTDKTAAVERAIADALKQHPFQGRNVVTDLSAGEFQVKNVRLPRMPAEELASAVEFEAQERFDLGGASAQFRHIPAGEVRHGGDTKEEIIVFAAPDEVIRDRLHLLERLKLRPVAVDVAPCAVARSFARFLRRAEDAQAVNVFLDVGWSATVNIITRGTHVSFLKVIGVGGKHFDEAVAGTLDITRPEAAALRIRIMRETGGRRRSDRACVPEKVRTAVTDAVRPMVEKLVRELQLCLRYYAVTFRGRRPESLTFVGGGAHEPLLIKTVGDEIDIPCIIGNPLRGVGKIGLLGGGDRRSFQPAWAVASGLALHGSKWVGSTVNHSASSTRRGLVTAIR